MTSREVADLALVSVERLRALRRTGVLRRGVHYTRPKGLGLRWNRAAIERWIGTVRDAPARPRAGKLNPHP